MQNEGYNAPGRQRATGSVASGEDQLSTAGQPTGVGVPAPVKRRSRRVIAVIAVALVVLTGLAAAGIRLGKVSRTVDQVVISTLPPGADVKFDTIWLGHSPVKLEEIPTGEHTIEVSKDGYETIVDKINLLESKTYDYKLKTSPVELSGLTPEEKTRRLQELGQAAFEHGNYAVPYGDSALYYADQISFIDESNQFAKTLKERVREALHKAALEAGSRGDLVQAQDLYRALVDNYPDDQEARTAAAKLESQLSFRRGDVRDLLRKADDALSAGKLTEPVRANAYYFSKLVLAIDPRNTRARAQQDQIKDHFVKNGELALNQGDVDESIRQFERASRYFPDDTQIAYRLREVERSRSVAKHVPATNWARERRVQGLQEFERHEFADAIEDLEYAERNGESSADVLAALGQSHLELGQLEKAEGYFNKLPRGNVDSRRTAVEGLADIADRRNDIYNAVARYEELRNLGGSKRYSVDALNAKIERLEKRQKEREAESSPVTIQVTHLHGGPFGRNCRGILTVNRLGVRYDGDHHTF
ncbi:MAG TPA: PEGA domain-containing protein, partial [Blastocatellia bacterium]|nr:PEGA domain-containing protein [Blastocatellia bacterium]